MASGLSGEDAGAGGLSVWRAVAGVPVWFGRMGVSGWLLHGWVEHHLGLRADLAWSAAAVPGGVLGALLLWKMPRSAPSADPEQRRRAAERSETGRRRLRAWVILLMCLVLLQQSVLVMLAAHGDPAGYGDWNSVIIVASLVTTGLTDFLPSGAGVSPGRVEFDQAERVEALRVGYLTLVVLGGLAAAAMMWRPVNAAQAWPFVLLASVLAAEIRMATLPRRAWAEPA